MDDQNQQTLTNYYYNSIDNQHLKKIAKFLLSAFVFSFCFSRSYMLSFLHSFNFYFSTFPYQLFTHAINKNFIFFICNMLFVVLAKHSGLTQPPSTQSYASNDETSFKNTEGGSDFGSPILETEEPVLPKEDTKTGRMDSLENVAAEEEHESEPLINQVEKHAEKEVVEEYEEQKEQEQESMLLVEEEEEEEEEEDDDDDDDGKLAEEDEDVTGRFGNSTEELNKKFEDFINRMKEELRIEAQRQLIMV
ncbi:hypothetical protein ACFX2A_007264 [Malus domestica]